MKIKKRVALIPVVLALLIAVFLGTKHDRPRIIKLPDGTDINLVAVGYERTNEFIVGPAWRQFLYRMMPGGKNKPGFGLRVITAHLWQTNHPLFFTRLYNENGIHQQISGVAVYDEYGTVYDGNGGGGSGMQRESDKEQYRYWHQEIYGPHSKLAGLHLYADAERTLHLAELQIPEIPLKPLPQTHFAKLLQKSDGPDVTLTSFTTGWPSEPDPSQRKVSPYFSQITFVVSTNGHPISDWFPDWLQVATNGGKLSSVVLNRGRRAEETVINFYSSLTATNISKLRLGLIRHGKFNADEIHAFKDLPFPDPGEVVHTNISVEIQGVTLTLERIGGADSLSNDDPKQPGQAYVLVRVSGPQKGMNVWIEEATDEKGQPLGTAGHAPWKNGQSFHWFQPSVKARKMNITFCVHKTHFFEFEVTPQVISTARP